MGARNAAAEADFRENKIRGKHKNSKRPIAARNFPISEKWEMFGRLSRFATLMFLRANSGGIRNVADLIVSEPVSVEIPIMLDLRPSYYIESSNVRRKNPSA